MLGLYLVYALCSVDRFWSSTLMADGKAVFMTTAPEMIVWATSPLTWWKSSRGQVTNHNTAVCARAHVCVRVCVCVWWWIAELLLVWVQQLFCYFWYVALASCSFISLFGHPICFPQPVNHLHGSNTLLYLLFSPPPSSKFPLLPSPRLIDNTPQTNLLY